MRCVVAVEAVAAAVLFVFAGMAGSASADGEATSVEELHGLALPDLESVPGFDISWPQCGKVYPPGPVSFGIIGINNGKPFTANPCFADQFAWAKRVQSNPAVYVNTAFPKPEETQALTGPWGTCDLEDGWCRGYNYGWKLAAEVVTRARSLGISPSHWWLDVETGNYWSSDVWNNSQVIRAALDYFKEQRLPVGIYGTPYQWRLIAWEWKSPGIPIWTAGAQGIDGARARCGPAHAFAGGTVVMVQYYDWGFDTNYICPGTESLFAHPVPHPIDEGPRGRTDSHLGAALQYWHVVPLVAN